jgi:pSer/pThr/pTyr-binding forkhead associated (FHA) protein
MVDMRTRLDQIETRLQAFIESSLFFLPGERKQDALAHQLVTAIEQAVVQEASGTLISPNLFTIRLHPNNLSIWDARPGLVEALARVLNEAAHESGVKFPASPSLQLQSDPNLAINEFAITATTRLNQVEETGVFLLQDEKSFPDTRPGQAFLILNGTITIPLRLAVMNIGRRADNQVVIEDPRVSRVHAQLRAVRGHYVLFDLNSTGGTLINGVRITQQALKPGDVISLAGVPLIYGEEAESPFTKKPTPDTGRLEINPNPPSH